MYYTNTHLCINKKEPFSFYGFTVNHCLYQKVIRKILPQFISELFILKVIVFAV